MRIITIRAPKGHSEYIAKLASDAEIDRLGIQQSKAMQKGGNTFEEEVIEVHTATPKMKKFIEAIMDSEFYVPKDYSFTIRHPESIFAHEPPKKETYPIVRPTTDVYSELWQFSNITISLVIRVFLSSILMAYGMREAYMPLIIAGLLFLPYHHHMLSMGLGASIGESKFLKQGFLAFVISTICIIAGGMVVAIFMEPGIKFTAFDTTHLKSFLISLIIGLAAGFGAIDDAGRRELIGLAATAHVSVYPAWFGMKFIFGFDHDDEPVSYLVTFLIDVTTITVASAVVFKLMKMHGSGIKKFVRSFS
ncbi:MAG: hypothetical protein ACNS60_14810 [Candidatus Cyclobacteriaceae bacterium M2_1C_046]